MKKNLLLIICLWMTAQLSAQINYYACDFENDTENALWSRNVGTQATSIPNKWVIDTAANNGGAKGLYISTDEGKTASYTLSGSYMICYRELQLTKGTYTLSFDWKAMGDMSAETSTEGLYVAWVPEKDSWGDPINLNSALSTTLSATIKTYSIKFNDQQRLCGRSTWQNAVTTITSTSSNAKYRLAFIWLSTNTVVNNPGACVDNIAVVNESCSSPTAVSATTLGSQVTVSWVPAAGISDYEVRCYSYTSKSWTTEVVHETDSVVLTGISEGLCDFYVRSVCDVEQYSAPASLVAYFLYYPDEHCISYLALDSTNCYVATEKVSSTVYIKDLDKKKAWAHEKVDFGCSEKMSRHTIHYDKSETDPRTGGGLKTVPADEIASVRLGNWNVGSEAERAEFKFYVDAKVNPVLLLKYAVVLEHPGDQCKPNPGFLLRVLDDRGYVVDTKCASADFDYSKAADADWNMYQPEGSSSDIRWKDWTTVGVNLAQYDGQTLTIQLTTYDCGAGGHFGYAYFTLGCSNGKMQDMTCESWNPSFRAPVGFKNRWYLESNRDTISAMLAGDRPWDESFIRGRGDTIVVGDFDTLTYAVDLMFPQDTDCYFTLTASALPHYPLPLPSYLSSPTKCENRVLFGNNSHIIMINPYSGDTTHNESEYPDRCIWDFGDGSAISTLFAPTHVFPAEGGDFTVSLTVYLNECYQSTTMNIHLPEVKSYNDTIYGYRCYKAPDYKFGGKIYNKTGIYTDSLLSMYGCDSISVLNLHITDSVVTNVDTLIIEGKYYEIAHEKLTKAGSYRYVLESSAQCDSIVRVNLRVHDTLGVEMLPYFETCHDQTSIDLPFNIYHGQSNYYSLQFPDDSLPSVVSQPLQGNAITVDIPKSAMPDVYKGRLTFLDTIGGHVYRNITIMICYRSDVMIQRWNDVLTLRQPAYNTYGYTFDAVQWYEDSQLLNGETQTYLYRPQGLKLGQHYRPLLTRKEGARTIQVYACPIEITQFDERQNIPTLVEKAQSVPVQGRGKATWYDVVGNALQSQSYDNSSILAPATAGMYFLQLFPVDSPEHTYRMMVK